MKTKLLFSLVLSLYIIGVNAQSILNGQIEIKDINIAKNEGSLFVSMVMDVSALEVKSNEEIVLTPALKSTCLPSASTGETAITITFATTTWRTALISIAPERWRRYTIRP